MDPTTGNETFIGFTSSGVAVLAFDVTTDTLYGITDPRGSALSRIDPNTGAVTIIGNTGFGNYTGLGADLNGNLFGVTLADILVRIDPSTGHGESVGTLSSGIVDLAVRPEDGTMFGIRNQLVGSKVAFSLLKIDTATAATTPVGEPHLNQTMSGLAFSPAVPEPSTVVLAAILSTFVCLRRTRSRGKSRVAIREEKEKKREEKGTFYFSEVRGGCKLAPCRAPLGPLWEGCVTTC